MPETKAKTRAEIAKLFVPKGLDPLYEKDEEEAEEEEDTEV
jgi:hypothetical protein